MLVRIYFKPRNTQCSCHSLHALLELPQTYAKAMPTTAEAAVCTYKVLLVNPCPCLYALCNASHYVFLAALAC